MVKCESWTEKAKLDVLHMSNEEPTISEWQDLANLDLVLTLGTHRSDDPVEPVTDGLFSHT